MPPNTFDMNLTMFSYIYIDSENHIVVYTLVFTITLPNIYFLYIQTVFKLQEKKILVERNRIVFGEIGYLPLKVKFIGYLHFYAPHRGSI